MTKKQLIDYIESHIVKLEADYRGGVIIIDLSDLLGSYGKNYTEKYEGCQMQACQNYLGGGMLGKICCVCNFNLGRLPATKLEKVEKMADALKRYFHNLTNHDDEWESESYLQNQNKPFSAY